MSILCAVQLQRLTPLPEQNPQKSQNRTFPVISYLAFGAEQALTHFLSTFFYYKATKFSLQSLYCVILCEVYFNPLAEEI